MLDCEEYQLLEETLQAQLLWLDGVFLMKRSTQKLDVHLYALYNFYVEVFFDQEVRDPLYFKPFDQLGYLDRYLDDINIDPAFDYTI
ncbi:MAG TPA: hypothetical protein VFR58_06345 [Flavisolibacter sp.]|nr:hypothetical protein [Flavisolibacter sp.]